MTQRGVGKVLRIHELDGDSLRIFASGNFHRFAHVEAVTNRVSKRRTNNVIRTEFDFY